MATATRIDRVHRGGAAALGVFLWIFGILGFVHQLPILSNTGRIFGLATNGALSAISLVVGTVLLVSAIRSGRTASTVTASIGVLFLVSGLVHLAVINTSWNILSFRLPNVFFSLAAGILLLGIGAYGRLAGSKRPGNPYRPASRQGRPIPSDDAELADAEQAMADGLATREQQQRVYVDAVHRQARQYDRAWDNFAQDHSPDEVNAMRDLEQRESTHQVRSHPSRPENS